MTETVQKVPPEENTLRRRLKVALGYVIALCCLFWVLLHVHPKHLAEGIRHVYWPLVLIAIAADNTSYILQGVRWRLLLKPVINPRFFELVQGIFVALFTNDVFPMRMGELVRAYLVSRWCSVKIAEVIPSMVVERMFEGIWLALGIWLVTLSVSLPGYFLRGAQVFGASILFLIILFLFSVFRRPKLIASVEHAAGRNRFVIFLEEVAIGLRKIGISVLFLLALAVTFGALALQSMAIWLVIQSYGLQLSLLQGVVVFLIVRLGIVVPTAPANIGTYQFFAALGLQLFGVDRSVATEFSLVLFILLGAPVWLLGFLAASRSGVSLFRLRHEAGSAMKQRL
jgi:glycosyltransferase 2 family protein